MIAPGIIIGQTAMGELIELPGEEHVALHARTRSGKGVSFSIPNCFNWPGSLVVLDVKGTAFQTTAGHRRAMGQDVYLFEPASRHRRSHRWNPFAEVDRGSDERFEQILRLANLLYPEIQQVGNSSTGNQEFWEGTARQAFNAVATIIAETRGEPLTVARILELFTQPDGHQILAGLVEKAKQNRTPYSLDAVNGLADYIGDDPKLRSDIRKSVSNRLQIWYDPKLRAATEASDFNLRDLRRRPITIYVAAAPRELQRLRPLLRLFWNAVINANTDVLPSEDPSLHVPVLMMMDEFARMGRVDTLAQAPQYVAEYGLRMAFVVQSKAQIRAIYGQDAAKDIFDNVGAEIVFGTTDPDLTKELEERLGDNTIGVTTSNKPRFFAFFNWNRQSLAEHPHRRQLMPDQEVAQMDPSDQLIIRAGMKPCRTKRVRWYDDPRFMHLALPPPVIPQLNVVVTLGPMAEPGAEAA